MKARWFGVLLALNLALIATCGMLMFRFLTGTSGRGGGTVEAPVAAEPAVEPVEAAPVPPPGAPTLVIQTNTFHWSQVESSDYRQYIANLRAIGCPEVTIKDIIVTDIMRLYALQRGDHSINQREFRFWETDEKRVLTARQAEARDRELARIDKQVPAVLRELLGVNYERELNKYFIDTRDEDRRLAFLSEAKKQQVLAIREQVEDMEERAREALPPGAALDPATRRQIEDQRRKLLLGVLTPEELDEYELSMSETADRLRRELVGFNPTKEEFRRIFQLRREVEAKLDALPEGDPARMAALAQLEEDIKAGLEPDRLGDYERIKNKDYQELCFFARQQELPAQVAQTVADYRQVAEQERMRLLASTQISEETRQTALKAIEAETIQAVRQVMGDSAFAAFLQGPGSWLQNLAAPPAAAPAGRP
ncbi:MAG TPA: hypothetical protein VNO52_15965 [Methylomirabilota bacterium]|nr:hypothetical protein [Methylomirabilota bacterium]